MAIKFASQRDTMTLAEIVESVLGGPPKLRFTAYDGSATGPANSDIRLHLRSERGTAYLVSAPGSLGLARAYVTGELEVSGVHPGNPYEALIALGESVNWRPPSPAQLGRILASLGPRALRRPPRPPQEVPPDWQRALQGLRHSVQRDSAAIHHHYDVSNSFYSMLLGPSMTYTCACFPDAGATLEQAQHHKHALVARKLGLQPGMRLLDVGCGWGGMVMHAAEEHGVRALGVTLSQQQAEWAQAEIRRRGLQDLAEVRHGDYRGLTAETFDVISSIGLLEHIGVSNYPQYFQFLLQRLRPGGRLLNHCITRHDNRKGGRSGFITRYVFPDGELTGSGTVISAAQDAGFEVRHEENLREHYARTCGAWCENLVRNWDACVAEAGEAAARIWGLYLAGSRRGFEVNDIQLHQVLAVRPHPDGSSDVELRPEWEPGRELV